MLPSTPHLLSQTHLPRQQGVEQSLENPAPHPSLREKSHKF